MNENQGETITQEKPKNPELLNRVTEASKFVLDKSIELACATIENLDRLAWMGVATIASAGGLFGSVEILGNILNDPSTMKVFGDAPQLARILSSVGMAATSGFLLQMSINGFKREKDLFDLKS